MTKKLLKKAKTSIKNNKRGSIILFAGIFAVVGVALLLISQAATPNASSEAEAGTETSPAKQVSGDSTASGSNYVLFEAPTSSTECKFSTSPIPTPPANPKPCGAPANIKTWTLAFRDEFNGTSLDLTRWADCWWRSATPPCGGNMNNVKPQPYNISVRDGNVILTLSDANNGALMASGKVIGAGANGYELKYGYAEARVYFPGPGDGTKCYNWPAWWLNAEPHPQGGENDIAEVLSEGDMTVNYHSPTGSHNKGPVPGKWCNGFHVFGAYRQPGRVDVYYDGVWVKGYTTDDDGDGEYLLFNVGRTSGQYTAYGAASQVRVDYARVWE